MRIGADRYRFEFQLLDGESTADFSSVPALQPLLRPWNGADPTRVGLQLVRVAEYTFQARVAQRWRAGPIFLLGDAAHLTPPFIGQGMGAGLRDAANLAWKLTAVLRGDLPESDLDSYQAERRPHARAMIRRAMAVGWVMTRGGRAGDLLRSALLPGYTGCRESTGGSWRRDPPLRRSTLVRPAPVRRGLAGRLCPNAVLDPSSRFDDRAGGRFALLTDLPVGTGHAARGGAGRCTVLRVDPSDRLGQWLANGDARAALVRPDGTVLAAASTSGGPWPRCSRRGGIARSRISSTGFSGSGGPPTVTSRGGRPTVTAGSPPGCTVRDLRRAEMTPLLQASQPCATSGRSAPGAHRLHMRSLQRGPSIPRAADCSVGLTGAGPSGYGAVLPSRRPAGIWCGSTPARCAGRSPVIDMRWSSPNPARCPPRTWPSWTAAGDSSHRLGWRMEVRAGRSRPLDRRSRRTWSLPGSCAVRGDLASVAAQLHAAPPPGVTARGVQEQQYAHAVVRTPA